MLEARWTHFKVVLFKESTVSCHFELWKASTALTAFSASSFATQSRVWFDNLTDLSSASSHCWGCVTECFSFLLWSSRRPHTNVLILAQEQCRWVDGLTLLLGRGSWSNQWAAMAHRFLGCGGLLLGVKCIVYIYTNEKPWLLPAASNIG